MEPLEELKKTARRVDQTLTGHSILRDEYARRSFLLDLALLVLAALMAFLAFANDDLADKILPSFLRGDLPISVVALLVFVVSVAQWRVGWKEKTAAHGEAANALARYKHELSKTLGGGDAVTTDILNEHLSHYQYINESVTKLPDRDFLRLKKAHKSKIEISMLLDEYPGASVRMLKIKVFLRDNFGCPLLKTAKEDDGERTSRK